MNVPDSLTLKNLDAYFLDAYDGHSGVKNAHYKHLRMPIVKITLPSILKIR